MHNFEQIIEDFVKESRVDYVGLWQLLNAVQHQLGITDEMEIRSTTLEIIKGLLSHGLEAVDLTSDGGFKPWVEMECGQVISRIEKEWNGLGREPNIGDICWFSNRNQTPKGSASH